MSIHNAVVSVNSNEKAFISAFIKSVMNEAAFVSEHTLAVKINSDTVSSVSNVDTVLDSNWSGSPSFSFTVDTNSTLTFTRPESLSQSSSVTGYNVSAVFGNKTISGGGYSYSNRISFGTGSIYASTETTRTWKYQLLSNSNVLYMVFGDYNEILPLSYKNTYTKTYQMFIYKKNTDWLGGFYAGGTLYDISGNEIILATRIPYINNATNPTAIETIYNKSAITVAGTTKVLTLDNIWDSSYNSAVMFNVNVNNDTCVYLNNYTLMLV